MGISCKQTSASIAQSNSTSTKVKAYKACNLTELGLSQSLGTPTTIAEALELINALPRPLDISCFISSLNRPLNVNITNSKLSAQPAVSNQSPRIFIFSFPLVIAITIDGSASYLVEFSEYTGSINTIKGELQFPIQSGLVAERAPFERIKNGGQTTCSACHRNEVVSTSQYPGIVYQSISLKPETSSKVEISVLLAEVAKCSSMATNYRCNLLYGVFKQGTVQQMDFPGGTPTFLESLRL
jgi:hypothetical protein